MFAKPHVAILCLEQYQLFSAVYGPHLHILATRLQISEATTLAQARRYLSSTVRPQAIIVADAFTTNPAYRDILFQLVDYAWAGGTVIYAGLVGCFTRPIDLNAAFQHVWGVPWRSSSFYQQAFSLNPSAKCISTDPKHVSHAYTMRARFVSKVELKDALYLEPLNVRRVELETGEQGQPTYETPAAFAPIGYGYFGFVGDVDGEEGTIKLLLAMCLRPGARAPPTCGKGVPAAVEGRHTTAATPISQGTRPREVEVVMRTSARSMNRQLKTSMALQMKDEVCICHAESSHIVYISNFSGRRLLGGREVG